MEQTGSNVLEQLAALDQTPLPADRRARIVELYHPYLMEFTETLERHLLDAVIPLSPANRAVAKLLLALCQRMGSNFSRLVFSPDFAAGDCFKANERRDLLLHNIDWLTRLGLHYAQIYLEPGVNYWRTVYRIFQLTDSKQIFSPHSDIRAEVQGHLARILLFSVATPHKFRPRELKQIDQFLQQFAQQAKFDHHSTLNGYKAVFFFDTKTPAPPKPIKLLGQMSPPPARLHFLFPQKVSRALLNFVTFKEDREEILLPPRQAKKLALHLARVYSAPKRRKWKRLEEDGHCQLVVGIDELLSILVAQNRIPDELFELLPSHREQTETEGLLEEDFELIPLSDDFSPSSYEQRSETKILWELAASRNRLDKTDIWTDKNLSLLGSCKDQARGRITNSSAEGYRLIWLDHNREKLKVGEIIGILHTQGEVEIGAIRWLKQEAKQAISIGVELISFAISGVVVHQHLPGTREAVETRRELGLLLPPQPALEKPAGLLLPTHGWTQGQWVQIYRNKSSHEIYHLAQLVDSTPVYDLFSLTPLN